MGALSRKLRTTEGGRVTFWCVGCDMAHSLAVLEPAPQRWTWNGDVEKPVFSPSVLVRWDSRGPAARQKSDEFHKKHGRYPTMEEVPQDVHNVCHSFVGCNGAKPGEIVYLGDSTHAYAGKTVPLPDFPGEWD